MTGVRADESLTRYRSVVNKLSENYICKPMVSQKGQQDTPDVKICKPIYDMSEADIFKYLWENDIKYCPTYDAQLFAGAGLRVATPLLAEGARRFCKLKTYEPTLYKQVIDIFPEMLAHERYFLDLDTRAIKEQYGQSIEGVRTWILENLTDEHEQAIALQRLDGIEGLHRNDPAAYSTKHILNYFMGGGYKRLIMPERTGGKHG